jgi:hypothetical protein
MTTFNMNDFEVKPKYIQMFIDKMKTCPVFKLGKTGLDGEVELDVVDENTISNQFKTKTGSIVKLNQIYKGQFTNKIENKGNLIEGLVAISLASKEKYGEANDDTFKKIWMKLLDNKEDKKYNGREYTQAIIKSKTFHLDVNLSTKTFKDLGDTDNVFHVMKKEVQSINNFVNSDCLTIDSNTKTTIICDGLSKANTSKSDLVVTNGSKEFNLSLKYGSSNKQIAQRNSANKLSVQKLFWKELDVDVPDYNEDENMVDSVYVFVNDNHRLTMSKLTPFILKSIQGTESLTLLHIKENGWKYLNPSLINGCDFELSTSLTGKTRPKITIWATVGEEKRALLSIRYKVEISKKINMVEKEEFLDFLLTSKNS